MRMYIVFYLISLDLFNLSVIVVLAALGPDEQYANYAGQSWYLYGSLFYGSIFLRSVICTIPFLNIVYGRATPPHPTHPTE